MRAGSRPITWLEPCCSIAYRALRMNLIRAVRWLVLMSLAVSAAGCGSLLPRANSASSAFLRFEDLRDAVDSLQPMKSDVAALVRLGIDPASLPNTTILSYADIVRRFVPVASDGRPELDRGILACLEARDACRGWELNAAAIRKVRTGGFLADFTNFRRRTETTGWRFNALILLAGDVVVYRAWAGSHSSTTSMSRQSAGPLQEIGPAAVVIR